MTAVDLFGSEVPGHQIFDALGVVVLKVLEDPSQPGFGIDAVHAGGLDQGVGHGGGFSAAL